MPWRGAGGRGVHQSFIRGSLAARYSPYVLHTIFDRKSTSFVYLLLKYGTPLTNLVFIFVPL